MKILYIPLNEYDTLEDLYEAFKTIANENNVSLNLFKNKIETKDYLYTMGKETASRGFYYEEATFDDVTRYVLYEALFD